MYRLRIPRPARVASSVGLALLLLVVFSATETWAQVPSCGDTLSLLSPLNASVEFEIEPVTGNRFSWDALDPSLTTCYVLADTVGIPFTVDIAGTYASFEDRDFSFDALNSGRLGDSQASELIINWSSRNEARGEVSGSFNLSNSGGIFRVTPAGADGSSVQVNDGIPAVLRQTNVRTLASWDDGAGTSRIYALIPGVPLVHSTDGGSNWTPSLQDPDDPLALALSAAEISGTHMSVSPSDPNLVIIGTRSGVFRSDDGGASFALFADQTFNGAKEVTYVEFEPVSGRLLVGINGRGLFESLDDGLSWGFVASLLVPPPSSTNPDQPDRDFFPKVNDIAVDPRDASVIYVALDNWGVYRSDNAGVSWVPADSNLVLAPSPEFPGGRKIEIRALLIDSSNPDVLLAASSQDGVFLSQDGGDVWANVSSTIDTTSSGSPVPFRKMLQNPALPDEIWGVSGAAGLHRSADGGLTWSNWYESATQPPFTRNLGDVIWNPEIPGELLVGTTRGGIYIPGSPLDLTETITFDPENLELETGLTLAFSAGATDSVRQGTRIFRIRAQTYQGFAVWRAQTLDPITDEPNWKLIGLYDLTNPEFCFDDPCDAPNPAQIQGCFADKRANCFDLPLDGSRQGFFDRDVFNGFTYWYAVTTFDYGFTGNVPERNLARDMVYSPRSDLESSPQATPFLVDGNYNGQSFTVNIAAASSLDQVWAVPNPLRRNAGWDGEEGASIRFMGVTADSRAEIFTLAGDLVATLISDTGNDGLLKGNMVWDTRNATGEDVASGVYIYRIVNDSGEEVVGKVTIIR